MLWETEGRIVEIQPVMYKSRSSEGPSTVIQIPLLASTAITPRNVQGLTFDALYIPSWRYCRNYVYVVLSRLRTLDNLFLGQPLNSMQNYAALEGLTEMLHHFQQTASASTFDYGKLPTTPLLHAEKRTQNRLHCHCLAVD
jgi:hypothetical protein